MSTALLRLARKPPVAVPKSATVLDAIEIMLRRRAGAALVLEDGRSVGVLTEHDLLARPRAADRDPADMSVGSAMSSPVVVVSADTPVEKALELMFERDIRHLPVVDADGRTLGIVSMRPLVRWQLERLRRQARSLANYIGAEGIAGG